MTAGRMPGSGPGRDRGLSSVQLAAAALGVIVVAFLALLATRDTQQNGPNNAIVGRFSPPVEGVSYTGEAFDLDAVLQRNRVVEPAEQTWVVVNFFASWCTGCVQEHPDLIRFDTEGATMADGTPCSTELVGVTFNDDAESVADFFERRGGDWPVLVGAGTNQVVIDFSVLTAPETVVIAPSGLVVEKFIGAVTYDDLVAGIDCAGPTGGGADQ